MIQFVREIPIRIVIQKTLSHRRGFLFHVSAGFAGEVDPLSGMVINLVVVDEWLANLKAQLEEQLYEIDAESLNPIFAVILSEAHGNLQTQIFEHDVELTSLNFREERGFGFQLSLANKKPEIEFYHTHYMELVPNLSEATLLRLTFYWQWSKGCEADYAHAGRMLLKPLTEQTATDLTQKLSLFKNYPLPTGTHLTKIQLHSLTTNTKLEL